MAAIASSRARESKLKRLCVAVAVVENLRQGCERQKMQVGHLVRLENRCVLGRFASAHECFVVPGSREWTVACEGEIDLVGNVPRINFNDDAWAPGRAADRLQRFSSPNFRVTVDS